MGDIALQIICGFFFCSKEHSMELGEEGRHVKEPRDLEMVDDVIPIFLDQTPLLIILGTSR